MLSSLSTEDDIAHNNTEDHDIYDDIDDIDDIKEDTGGMGLRVLSSS